MSRGRRTAAEAAALRADGDLRRIKEFVDLVADAARSPRQRERILRAAGASLTPASLGVLHVVGRRGELTVTGLAAALGLDASTVSRQLRPCEQQGLVRRTADVVDRRIAHLRLTARGRRLLEQVRDVGLSDLDVALRSWTPADRSLLAELLARARTGMLTAEVDEAGRGTAGTAGATPRTRPA